MPRRPPNPSRRQTCRPAEFTPERIAESRVQQDNEQWHLLLFRQIGYDERVHKQESLAQAAASRFR